MATKKKKSLGWETTIKQGSTKDPYRFCFSLAPSGGGFVVWCDYLSTRKKKKQQSQQHLYLFEHHKPAIYDEPWQPSQRQSSPILRKASTNLLGNRRLNPRRTHQALEEKQKKTRSRKKKSPPSLLRARDWLLHHFSLFTIIPTTTW